MRISITSDILENISGNKLHTLYGVIDGEYYHSYSLYELYKNYRYKFVERINGEYSIILFDKYRNLLYAYTDIFGTKPLYFGLKGKKFKISSFKHTFKDYDFVKRIPNSSILKLNLHDNQYDIEKHSKFDLTEKYDNLDRCIDALKEAIDIRTGQYIGTGVSGGHDTGAIIQRLSETKKKCKYYYFDTGKEDKDIIDKRIKKYNLKLNTINYKVNQKVNERIQSAKLDKSDVDLNKDKDLISLLIPLYEKASKDGVKNYLSGLGGDEVLKNNTVYPIIDEDLSINVDERDDFLIGEYPGDNSEEGVEGRFWIDVEEYISNLFGINLKYPFLDKKFIQEYLNLTFKAKNSCYKAPTQRYLTESQMPYMLIKSGFSSK